MAVAWRRHHQPVIESQPWRVISGGGREYVVKSLFREDSYDFLVSDLCTVWRETLERSQILRRTKSLNPSVEAPLPVLLGNLHSHVDSQQTNASYSFSQRGEELSLSISTSLSGLPFQWEFQCEKAGADVLSCQLVTPLLSMGVELCRRQEQLQRLLARKDREIQDYKEGGAKVSRRHLETAPFDEKAFLNEMMLSKEFETNAQHPLRLLDEDSCQELYRNVAMIRTWADKKEELPAADATVTETTGTWAGKIPASLLPSPSHPPIHTSPTKSPVKRPAEESPSKDDERSRREALERKLEDDKLKGKKKKKKLM